MDDVLNGIAGTIQTAPFDKLSNRKQDALGDIQNLLDNNVLQNLINAKAAGATFGALSDAELKMLQSSASVLSSKARRDDNNNIV